MELRLVVLIQFWFLIINLNNQVYASFIFVLNQISRSSAGEIILNNGTYLLLIPNHVENFHSLYLNATYLRKRTGKKGFNSLISFSILKQNYNENSTKIRFYILKSNFRTWPMMMSSWRAFTLKHQLSLSWNFIFSIWQILMIFLKAPFPSSMKLDHSHTSK